MSKMPWFRLYHEARSDAKLRLLADDEHRVWFDLLCFSSEQETRGSIATGDDRFPLAVEVAHGDVDLLSRTVARLVKLRIVTDSGDRLTFCDTDSFLGEEHFSTRPARHVWRVIRQRILERDSFTCRYCGARGGRLECDHIIPVARGGGSEDGNLTTACYRCNRSKRDKTLEEWQP